MPLFDIVRSIVTNAMLVILLFTLARPKYKPWTLWTAFFAIVLLDLSFNIFFYLRDDYTTLAMVDIAFFVLVGIAVKPLFWDTPMQWLFNCFTAINLYAVAVVISYYLCDLFPYPQYAITVLRALLFAGAILLFRRYLRPLYRQVVKNWNIYLFVAAGLFANFAWFFASSDDVEATLIDSAVPLLLLVMLTFLVYLAIFLSLRKTLRESALREENLNMQSDRELTRQRLTIMDEAVQRMGIMQHDQRHFNHTLSSLLREGETSQALALLDRQNQALSQKPRVYCQNVAVNAAVSYYAELAQRKDIFCDIRLNIPESLAIDELSLATAVSNLMENAINAVSALPENQRILNFTAVYTGQLLLELTNPFSGEVTLGENGLPFAVEDGHGRGTQSVAAFVNSCGGELLYQVSDGIFRVRILL